MSCSSSHGAVRSHALNRTIMSFHRADWPGRKVAPNLAMTQHAITIRPICFSKTTFDRLPEDLQAAIRRAGMEPVTKPIRGGTDGSKLSFKGLPTPNVFAGEQSFHSRFEWVSAQDMEKAVEVIVEIAKVWEEKT